MSAVYVSVLAANFTLATWVVAIGQRVIASLCVPVPIHVAPIRLLRLSVSIRSGAARKPSARDTLGSPERKFSKSFRTRDQRDEVSPTDARKANPKFAIEQWMDIKGDE